MAFHVNWKPSARDRITEIWIDATDRGQITRATDLIDETLSAHPETFGESRGGNLRIAFVFPLAVLFEVFPGDLRVDVLAIRRTAWRR
jgi:hypothetical protein